MGQPQLEVVMLAEARVGQGHTGCCRGLTVVGSGHGSTFPDFTHGVIHLAR